MLAVLAGAASLAAMAEPAADQTAPAPTTIQWMDWSDKAFGRATAEGKPILLYVRAPWSRASLWTDEVSFTDPDVVKVVNERWVPIRVDRDRRPDIDLRYQIAVTAAFSGREGWPLIAFLTNTGEIFGSSFVSLKDRWNRPGLKTRLTGDADFYAGMREKAAGTQQMVREAFQRELAAARPPDYGLQYVEVIAKDMVSALDHEYGGFGDPPRVPLPFSLELAGTVYHLAQRQDVLDVLIETLKGMERGAIYDRVGGGFHRAVTDIAWRLPEFEKLLSYNAPLLVDYLMGYEITGDPILKHAAESTLDFVLGTLKDADGCFYVGQWAASKSDEPRGTYYAWSEEVFKKAIPSGLERLAQTLYHVTPEGDLVLGPPARSLLYMSSTREEVAIRLGIGTEEVVKGEAQINAALAKSRGARSAPPVEKAIYVDSSSSAIVAMFEAWRVLGRKDALDAGVQSLDRLLAATPKHGPMPHRVFPPPEPGMDPALALDHMMLAQACLSGFETTGRPQYLAAARDLVDRATALFWDGKGSGFFDIVSDPDAKGYLTIRRRPPADTAYPALNSIAARVLARLSLLTGEASYREKGETCLRQLVAQTTTMNYFMGGLGLALDAYLRPPARYVVVGSEDDSAARDLRTAASHIFDPGKLVVSLVPGRDDREIARLKLKGIKGPFAVVCRGEKCSEPARDDAALRALSTYRAPGAESGGEQR